MKTHEMLNDYVMNHLLGESGQAQFVTDFITALGLELDGRLVKFQSGEFCTKIRAGRNEIETFICGQIMSKSFGCFEEYSEPFSIIEIEQPAMEWGILPDGTIVSYPRVLAGIEQGAKNAAKTENM